MVFHARAPWGATGVLWEGAAETRPQDPLTWRGEQDLIGVRFGVRKYGFLSFHPRSDTTEDARITA
jgi:hypothetical protein